jgi:hypothetical protein
MNLFSFDIRSIIDSIKEGDKSKLIAGVLRRFYRSNPPEGVKVIEQDWDYLIVLDACRYDVFEEVYNELDWLEGDLSKKTSRGSMSIEWLNRNFTDYYGDTVYLSANTFVSSVDIDPHYGRKEFDSSEHFHDLIPLYMDDELKEGSVTTPEAVTEKAIEASNQYPDKRFILHYMQPHEPYIGEDYYAPEKLLRELRSEGKSFDEIRKYYKANLIRALESVRDLMEEVDGKFVITSDHGELFGEYGMHTHPHSVYVSELVQVPWLEITKGQRRGISEDESIEQDDYDEEEIKDQLANLGYDG